MISSYRFDSNYQAEAGMASAPSFHLLEGGVFDPGQYCPVLTSDMGKLRIHYLQWGNEGIHPIYHKRVVQPVHPSGADSLVFPSVRCLIPANAYYFRTPDGRMWKAELPESDTFCFAGHIYQRPNQQGEISRHFSVLATASNQTLQDFHGLMPLILPRQFEKVWLNQDISPQKIHQLISQPADLTFTVRELRFLREQDHQRSELAA